MESASVLKTSHRVVVRLTHVAFRRLSSPFLNPNKLATYLVSIPVLQKSGADCRRVPYSIDESMAVRSHLEVSPIMSPIEVSLNRLALYFLCFEADWETPVRCTSFDFAKPR